MCKDVSEITGIQACALNAGTHLNVLIRHLEVKAVILFMKISLDVLYVLHDLFGAGTRYE